VTPHKTFAVVLLGSQRDILGVGRSVIHVESQVVLLYSLVVVVYSLLLPYRCFKSLGNDGTNGVNVAQILREPYDPHLSFPPYVYV
jgi:hypothetical protein